MARRKSSGRLVTGAMKPEELARFVVNRYVEEANKNLSVWAAKYTSGIQAYINKIETAVKSVEETVRETIKKPQPPPSPSKPMTLEEMIEEARKRLLEYNVPKPLVEELFQVEKLINVLRARKEKCEQERIPDNKCIEHMLRDIHDFLHLEGTERYQLFTLEELLKRYPHVFFSTPGKPGKLMTPIGTYKEILDHAEWLKGAGYKPVREQPSLRNKSFTVLFFDLNLEVVIDKKEEKIVITSHDVIVHASDHDKKEFYYYWYLPNPWLKKPRHPPDPFHPFCRYPEKGGS